MDKEKEKLRLENLNLVMENTHLYAMMREIWFAMESEESEEFIDSKIRKIFFGFQISEN